MNPPTSNRGQCSGPWSLRGHLTGADTAMEPRNRNFHSLPEPSSPSFARTPPAISSPCHSCTYISNLTIPLIVAHHLFCDCFCSRSSVCCGFSLFRSVWFFVILSPSYLSSPSLPVRHACQNSRPYLPGLGPCRCAKANSEGC